MKNFLALDCGATSCRAILATFQEASAPGLQGRLADFREVSRIPNNIVRKDGKCYWDIEFIFNKFVECIKALPVKPDSIGIDTWGVDFGHISPDGRLLGMPRAYRDPYTDGIPEEVFQKCISAEELYSRTGLQVLNFNSLFQLYAQKKESYRPYNEAGTILFIPDLLIWMFTGEKVCEYTEGSTSGLIDPRSKQVDQRVTESIGINKNLFASVVHPGQTVGYTKEDLGIGRIPVVAVASHDTASAIAAVPAEDDNFAYLSSGTWSLMGVETTEPVLTQQSREENFTNEGGIDGTVCYLKNITGMWLLEECRRKWKEEGIDCSYSNIVEWAKAEEDFPGRINPDDPQFANPSDMAAAIAAASGARTPAQIASCIYQSLALRYKEVLEALKRLTGKKIERLHIIGGGSANDYLNQLTANTIGLPVVAGPTEATAIGNVLIQARAAGLVEGKADMRRLVCDIFPVKTFNQKQ